MKEHYTIKQVEKDSEPAGNYNYEIYLGSALIARYWHDFRGDDHGIEFVNGQSDNWPVGRMIEFIEGKPVKLSSAAINYLKEKNQNK